MSNSVKKWKKKTYMNVDVLLEDTFYAKTPDLDRDFPPSNKALFTIIERKEERSTLEEIPIEDESNEEIVEENTSMDKPKSTQI